MGNNGIDSMKRPDASLLTEGELPSPPVQPNVQHGTGNVTLTVQEKTQHILSIKQISNSRNEDYKQNVSFLSFSYSRQDLDIDKKSNPPAMSRDIFNYIRLLRAPSNLTLNVSRDGASTTSLGNLFQCFTTLIVTNFFLISILEGRRKVSPEPSLLQAEQLQLSQPVLVGEVFQPSDHFRGPPLDPLQQLHVFRVLRAPELDAVLQVRSHQSGVEGQNPLPRPAGHASFDAAQDTVGLLGCERTLPAHVQLFIHQYPQVLFRRAALNHIIPQPVLIPGVAPTQDPALGLVEPHEVHMGPLLQLVQAPLDGILSLRRVNYTTQLGVICKLPEGALDLAVNVIDENIEQHWSQYGPLRDITCHRPPSGLDIESLTTTLWMQPSNQFLIH
ncbi:LOW QUALITY PROTEIN: hypothetical protein QYF61_024448 [Mycteria americana]|uniref:Uncharacterized protein n=1 Tax=Mycteria americana TaxID=33587 RepID=A0AAN7N9T4_MYCAM|nr:LOW QUALITY PROTEIN: hypothetical protein QYF61_024448 [Mycteria americana]